MDNTSPEIKPPGLEQAIRNQMIYMFNLNLFLSFINLFPTLYWRQADSRTSLSWGFPPYPDQTAKPAQLQLPMVNSEKSLFSHVVFDLKCQMSQRQKCENNLVTDQSPQQLEFCRANEMSPAFMWVLIGLPAVWGAELAVGRVRLRHRIHLVPHAAKYNEPVSFESTLHWGLRGQRDNYQPALKVSLSNSTRLSSTKDDSLAGELMKVCHIYA